MSAASDTRENKDPPRFPIVGIGASAGGLRATEAFLKNTPADSGMAFVLVFHLDPKHKSEAASLLQGHTEIPIAQIEDRTPVRPDHVYVIPPNRGLSLANGELVLTELIRADGRPTVIDRFFRSLADAAGERAIGVVLSGTGTEGSQGLKAIKEAGGLTVVQDENEAEYGGMPHSAIATGLVDFVLPVAEMPAKLLEVKDFAVHFALPEADRASGENDAEILQKIFVQLRSQIGHDFSHYKQNTVLRRIARRMQVHQLQDLNAYLEMLRDNPAETEALFRELLISVTNFFRDPEAMTALEREVIPPLCKRAEGQTVRIWVPGCATGEEAYSLAMLLAEACDGLASPPRLQIFASDVDERALETARRGLYPDAIAGDVTDKRLKRFFERDGDDFVVKGFLRETILFTRHDILRDPPFSRLDLISCRNLLIYLKADIQPKVFALFHFALKPQSYLFLGSSESLGVSGKLFTELNRKAKIFQARRAPGTEVHFPLLPTAGREGPRRREKEEAGKSFQELARDQLLLRYAPPSVIVNENYDITYIAGRVGKFLEPGSGTANYNVLDMAREGLRLELRTALYRALHGGEGTRGKRVRVRTNGKEELIALTVQPLAEAEGHLLVVFEELEPDEAEPEPPRAEGDDGVIAQLEMELTSTRESLQTSIEELETSNEELRASNEELQSMNEELQSTTEELETGKEELQSANEELLAVNQELQSKNDELARSYGDLNNFIASTDIGTLFLDEELRVRRYTPRMAEIFNLIAGDVGRPFAHLTHNLVDGDLVADAGRVQHDLAVIERELGSEDGRVYQVRLKPYRTADNKVGGVVLTFVDVTRLRRQESDAKALNVELEVQKDYAESIVRTVREPMLVLDSDLRVVTANRAFYRVFATRPEATEHTLLYEQDDGAWDIPELRKLLGEILPERTVVEDFEVRHDFGTGERVILLNARRLRQQEGSEPLILLALEDITESRHAMDALRASESKYRELFNSIDECFCLLEMLHDDAGKVVDFRVLEFNPAFSRATGMVSVEDRTAKELVPGLDPYWFEVLGEVAATGKPTRFERDSEAQDRAFDLYAFRLGEAEQSRVAVLFRDITQRKREEQDLVWLASIVDTSDDAIISKDVRGIISSWNRSAERMFGYRSEEAIGQSIASLIIPADRLEEEDDILRRIRRGESVDHFETIRRRKDGSTLDVSVTISPLRDETGRVIGASKVAREITTQKRAERHRQLLLNELNHRVKNTLVTIQSIAAQTFAGSPADAELVWRFESRLMALAKAHNLLVRRHWRDASLHELLDQELAPFVGDGRDRLAIEGDDLDLPPNAALALGMAFHELATNAIKHGALLNPTGKIRVVAKRLDSQTPRLCLTWTESGGPPVRAPRRRGFGTRLISGGLSHELGATARMDYRPEGFVCTMEIPLPEKSGGG